MEFRIADTFTDSLARLTGDQQKAVKTAAFDLQLKPANPGMSFHRLDKAKDKNFWSVWVGTDIRLIVHRSETSLLLCYVDHHDKAYAWAERRKLETHPKTGAAQLVEIRETVKEIVVPAYVQPDVVAEPGPFVAAKPLFAGTPDDELLSFGVPAEWLNDVKHATEDTLLALSDHLPAEAAEALLELATGGKPRVAQPVAAASAFEHPDAQRRFRVMANVEELERALDFPWGKWTVFLHPEQRQWVERVRAGLKDRKLITVAELFTALAAAISKNKNPVFDFAVVDEAQDISVAHLRFFAALGGRPNALFFAGDLGQRIFQQPFSWKSLGVDIRGRSRTLRVNYRTSHQIRTQADRLLAPVVTDVDGNVEDRSDTVSVFNGPPPTIQSFKNEDEEITAVCAWIAERSKEGVLPHEVGLFVRSEAQLDRARHAVEKAGMPFKVLDEHVETSCAPRLSMGRSTASRVRKG